jgi:hypothetical protein
MKKLSIDDLIALVDAYDENPPNPEFDLEDFGKEVGDGCDSETARDIVFACLTRLYHNVARTFLSGFLSVVHVENLAELLFDRLVSTDDVSASATIVEILIRFAKLSPAEVADGLLDRFATAENEQVQANLSYGVWAMVCMYCWDLRDDSTTRFWTYPLGDSASTGLVHRLESELKRDDISKYARDRFSECINGILRPPQQD